MGRVVAPPPFQAVVGQGPRTGPNMLRPRIHAPMLLNPAHRETVIDAGRAALPVQTSGETCGGKRPFVQRHAADAERIGEVLVGPAP